MGVLGDTTKVSPLQGVWLEFKHPGVFKQPLSPSRGLAQDLADPEGGTAAGPCGCDSPEAVTTARNTNPSCIAICWHRI